MTKSCQRTGKPRWTRTATAICSLAVVGVWFSQGPSLAQETGATQLQAVTSSLNPDPASALNTPAVALSAEEREALMVGKRQLRESIAATTSNNPPGPASMGEISGKATEVVVDGKFPSPPSSIIIRRNNQDPPNLSQSSLAEPSAANNGAHVLATGNFSHKEYSANGGATWTKSVFPGGPADAPLDCCDNDVIHDRGRGVTFLSTLYLNSARTNGVVRIFVYRNISGWNCSYTIDPAGTNNNILPDYPHLGKSNNHLYLTLNNIIGGTSAQAQVWRLNIDQMADCATTSVNVANLPSSVGQRVVTPADGAQETQYFSWAENTSQIRIFVWPQANAAPFSVLRATASSSFGNPDCRGGTLNNDFTDSLWSSIHGFNRRGAVGHGRVYFYWNVGPDTSHPQGHVHSATFTDNAALSLVSQTPMFITGQCNGIPGISTNDRGDLGITTAIGGKAGGGGTAARGYVGISDDFAGTIGFFPTVVLTASGSHNRADQRYGDYFGIHRHNPCGNSWSAMNYALSGGNGPTSVNSRYIEFGRGRDIGCNNEYINAAPAAQ